mmetsp:Transcript_45454/g.144579  ORF Transcript_45454/g.144579 Transcript_45454/m.144579 type:complete len:590 (-) Transcript_45454:168-1937(-)
MGALKHLPKIIAIPLCWKFAGPRYIACVIGGVLFGKHIVKHEEDRITKRLATNKLKDLTKDDIKLLMGEIPAWVKFPEYERVSWLNNMIQQLWPFVDEGISELIRGIVEPLLEKFCPPVLSGIKFDKLTLGDLAPFIGGIKFLRLRPMDHGVIIQNEEVSIEIDFKWGGNPDIILGIKMAKNAASIPIRLADMQVFGKIRISLKPLAPKIPFFKGITISAVEVPTFDFKLEVIGGDLTALGPLESIVHGIIGNILKNILVWPNAIQVKLDPTADLDLQKRGKLYMRLVSGRDLAKTDTFGSIDPFIRMEMRSNTMQESTHQNDTQSPVWDEVFEFVVFDTEIQTLNLRLFDFERSGFHSLVGGTDVSLANLEPGKVWEAEHTFYEMADNDSLLGAGTALTKGALTTTTSLMKKSASLVVGGTETKKKERPSVGKFTLELCYVPFSMGSIPAALSTWQLPPPGVLTITLFQAMDLESASSVPFKNTADPYVVFKMGEHIKKSAVMDDTLSPDFKKEKIIMMAVDPDICPEILVEVYHKGFGVGKDKKMGYFTVPTKSVIASGKLNDVFKLTGAKTGKVHIEFSWDSNDLE